MYQIYTDGACRGNDGTNPCSWAFAVYDVDGTYKGHRKGIIEVGTNNIAELTAVIEAIKWSIKHAGKHSVIYTDSSYVANGCSTWVHNWARNSWRKSDGKEIANLALWKEIYKLYEDLDPTILVKKVKGHNGIVGNEKADSLCNEVLDEFKVE